MSEELELDYSEMNERAALPSPELITRATVAAALAELQIEMASMVE